jgi:hypothetical protein
MCCCIAGVSRLIDSWKLIRNITTAQEFGMAVRERNLSGITIEERCMLRLPVSGDGTRL